LKVASLVAGKVAGAEAIEDRALLRHGGMGKVFTNAYAPSTLGSFLRSLTFGHVRQLDAVAARFLTGLATTTPLVAGVDEYALVDIDDTIIEVHVYGKQGSGCGYAGVRALNALLATVTADKTPGGHAIIEQVHAELKNSALAHLPLGKFNANAAWLVLAVMAFNLTRAAATLAGPAMAKATTATIRSKLVHVPARIASSARRLSLRLPSGWPWETAWTTLFTGLSAPPPAVATT